MRLIFAALVLLATLPAQAGFVVCNKANLPAKAQIPGFVYLIIASLFVAFNIFAVTMVLQYRKTGRWRNYLVGEKTYMVLSLVAKSLLAWQVFAGTLAG